MNDGGGEGMTRGCYSRNIQDLLADGKTPSERRYDTPFREPITLSGTPIFCDPISTKKVTTGFITSSQWYLHCKKP